MKRKNTTRSSLERHQQEHERNLAKIAKLTARNETLEKLITEEENTEIIALVRSIPVGLDKLQSIIEGLRRGEVPFPVMNANTEEGMTHEE